MTSSLISLRQFATCALVALAWVACSHEPSPKIEPASAAPATPTTVPEPKRFELVQGKPVDVGRGTTVELKSVLYAHLSDSRNNSLLTMDVTRGATHEEVTLDRLDPVGKEGPKYRGVMGLRMAIDYVDAYHQPSTAAILVLPE